MKAKINKHQSAPFWLFLMLAVAFCAGCVSRQAKPSSWPQEREIQDARDIEGTFEDVNGALRAILPWPETTQNPSVHVTISEASTIQLEFVLDSGAKKTVDLPFKIENGWLIATHGSWVNRDAVVGHDTVTFYIRTDATGALIVRHATRSIGALFFIPAVGTTEYWSRLPKKNP